MNTDNYQIGIAGAGVSGLVAALHLLKAGYAVTILEARSRSGGRIHSLHIRDIVVETGPEFIHGNLKETIALLDKYNIRYEPADGKMYSSFNGKLAADDDMPRDWEEVLDAMRSLPDDVPLNVFLDLYFKESKYENLRAAVSGYAAGFDLAEGDTASTKALLLEWENEDDVQYRIAEGYGKLITALETDVVNRGGRILHNHIIKDINISGEQVSAILENSTSFIFDKMIVTVPAALLGATDFGETIHFSPGIDEKRSALAEIGYGTVIKVATIWKSSFWEKSAPDALFIFSDAQIPTWWTQAPGKQNILTGWLGGPKAIALSEKSNDALRLIAIDSLSRIFSVGITELEELLIQVCVFNWTNEPWSRGAYSYSKVGFEKSKSVLRNPIPGPPDGKPLQNFVYFAGEAYYHGTDPGTVEAAIVSGLTTAKALLTDNVQ